MHVVSFCRYIPVYVAYAVQQAGGTDCPGCCPQACAGTGVHSAAADSEIQQHLCPGKRQLLRDATWKHTMRGQQFHKQSGADAPGKHCLERGLGTVCSVNTLDNLRMSARTSSCLGHDAKLNHSRSLMWRCFSCTRSASHTKSYSSFDRMFSKERTRISSRLWPTVYNGKYTRNAQKRSVADKHRPTDYQGKWEMGGCKEAWRGH